MNDGTALEAHVQRKDVLQANPYMVHESEASYQSSQAQETTQRVRDDSADQPEREMEAQADADGLGE